MPKSTKRLTLHTEALNSYGYRMLTDGMELKQFKLNPVMLWNHMRPDGSNSDQVLPIGYWDDIEVKNGSITAVPVFDDNDDFAMKIYYKVENGTLKMASIGVIPIEHSYDPALLVEGQTLATITKSKVLEASIVDIGANDDCLTAVLFSNNGQMLTLAETLKIVNPIPPIQMTEKEKEAKAKAEAETTEMEELKAKLKALQDENAELRAKLAAADESKKEMAAAALVSAAVDAGKLVPTQAETYKKLAMADYESTKLAIDSLPVQMSAKERIKGAAGDVALNQQKLAALSAKSFTELHRSGELEWLKLNAPDVYEAKYIEKFNKKPNA